MRNSRSTECTQADNERLTDYTYTCICFKLIIFTVYKLTTIINKTPIIYSTGMNLNFLSFICNDILDSFHQKHVFRNDTVNNSRMVHYKPLAYRDGVYINY